MKYNTIIIGSGPAGLGAAFELVDNNYQGSILIVEKNSYSLIL
jgi:thioredoxin reductase